ncbi:MAG: DsrE family protein [Chlorobi bacterium]|nr:DsrE family protein [Chlorobiota bacterium]
MKKFLIIINDAPYGSEKAYNALRMAITLRKNDRDAEINVFLMADAVTCALPGQKTPDGYYNIERMLKIVLLKGGRVLMCGACSDARGIRHLPFIEGAVISTMVELAQLTADCDQVLTY